MRVFVAGATGAIGRRLVPKLVERGHEVIGTSRSMDRAQRLHTLGGEPVALDLLDRSSLGEVSNEEDRGGPDLQSLEVLIGGRINKGHTINDAGRVREEIVTSDAEEWAGGHLSGQ